MCNVLLCVYSCSGKSGKLLYTDVLKLNFKIVHCFGLLGDRPWWPEHGKGVMQAYFCAYCQDQTVLTAIRIGNSC